MMSTGWRRKLIVWRQWVKWYWNMCMQTLLIIYNESHAKAILCTYLYNRAMGVLGLSPASPKIWLPMFWPILAKKKIELELTRALGHSKIFGNHPRKSQNFGYDQKGWYVWFWSPSKHTLRLPWNSNFSYIPCWLIFIVTFCVRQNLRWSCSFNIFYPFSVGCFSLAKLTWSFF